MPPRRRLTVALVVTGAVAHEIDGLRRALGAAALERIAPHCTLVPPLNVREEHLDTVLDHLRSAAGRSAPIAVTLGPPGTFWPRTPVLYLAVGGDLDAIAALRSDLGTGPLAPPAGRVERDFVPHVTLDQRIDPARLPQALEAMADYRAEYCFERVCLLEQDRRASLAAARGRGTRRTGHCRPWQPGAGDLGGRAGRSRHRSLGRRAMVAVLARQLRRVCPPHQPVCSRRPSCRAAGCSRRGRDTRAGAAGRPDDRRSAMAEPGSRITAAPRASSGSAASAVVPASASRRSRAAAPSTSTPSAASPSPPPFRRGGRNVTSCLWNAAFTRRRRRPRPTRRRRRRTQVPGDGERATIARATSFTSWAAACSGSIVRSRSAASTSDIVGRGGHLAEGRLETSLGDPHRLLTRTLGAPHLELPPPLEVVPV